MNRAEHMAWAKTRALELVDQGDLVGAFASFTSDLGKHPECENALRLQMELGAAQLVAGHLATTPDMRHWIEGFA